MATILFILGLPGCGKSSAVHSIQKLAEHQGWTAQHFCDYDILYEMYQEDSKQGGRKFKPAAFNGFDVCVLKVFDDGLKELVDQVLKWIEQSNLENNLCIIEFARDDYCEALRLFPPAIFQNAYFLFIDAEVEVCRQRVKDRVAKPETPDDHYVSDYIFDAYYNEECQQRLASTISCLKESFHIGEEMITLVENSRISKQEFLTRVESFVTPFLKGLVPVAS